MKQSQFEQTYQAQWQRFANYLERLEQAGRQRFRLMPQRPQTNSEASNPPVGQKRPKAVICHPDSTNVPLSKDELSEFSQLYRKVCHYHALARDRQYSSYLVDSLGDLVVRGHQQFYQRRYRLLQNLLRFLAVDFPQLVRREQRFVWLATALLYLPALAFFAAVLWQPPLVYTVVGPAQVQDFEAMYNPDNAVLGSARDAATNWHMFGFYINNNIGVAFRTFASGLLWGAGSIFFLFYNGLLFGAVAGHLTEIGYTDTFFTFVIGHGSFELTAITIAGAAGLRLGYSLLVPGQFTRMESLRRGAAVAIKLVYGVIFMLVVAAFIEAFWSSSGLWAYWQKYLVGAVLWAVVVLYLTCGGRRGSH